MTGPPLDEPTVATASEGSASVMSNKAKKQVRFDSEESSVVCTLPNREDLTEEDIEVLYFSRSDYHLSRSSAKVVSKESERYGFSKNLDNVWTEKSKETQDRLNLWVAHGHSRRGLERWANRDHGEVRRQDQFAAIMAVLRAQDDMLAEKRKIDHDGLRKLYHKTTKVSRHFARMMGKADAYAVTAELKSENEDTELMHLMKDVHLHSLHTKEDSRDAATSDDDLDLDLPAVDELADSTHSMMDSLHSDLSKSTSSSKDHKGRFRFSFGRKHRAEQREQAKLVQAAAGDAKLSRVA